MLRYNFDAAIPPLKFGLKGRNNWKSASYKSLHIQETLPYQKLFIFSSKSHLL